MDKMNKQVEIVRDCLLQLNRFPEHGIVMTYEVADERARNIVQALQSLETNRRQ